MDCSLEAITIILKKISDAGKAPALSVLKKFIRAMTIISLFPEAGYTLAMDFKRDATLLPLLDELDEIVLSYEGGNTLRKMRE